MSTSRQAFSQVKDILKKLDQSIDAARAKRVSAEPTPASRPAQPVRPAEASPSHGASPHQARPNGYQPPPSGSNGSFGRRVG